MVKYTDFYYENKCVSDFDFIAIRPSDGTSTFGLSREVIKTELNQNRNTVDIYGVKYTDTLPLNFMLMKNPCIFIKRKDLGINAEELEEIQTWLLSPKTAKKLTIANSDDTKEYYGIFTEVTPYEVDDLYGIKLTFVCNAPYGFRVCGKKIECLDSINKNLINETNELYEYIYPTITLYPENDGVYSITNLTDNNNIMSINLPKKYTKVIIDCGKQRIIADGEDLSLFEIGWSVNEIIDWNNIGTGIYKLYWLRLLPSLNNLVFKGKGLFDVEYRVPVKTGGY